MYEAPRIEATETIAGALNPIVSQKPVSDAEVKFGAEQLDGERNAQAERGHE